MPDGLLDRLTDFATSIGYNLSSCGVTAQADGYTDALRKRIVIRSCCPTTRVRRRP